MDIEAQDKRRGESRTGWLLVLVCIICHKLSICDRIWEKNWLARQSITASTKMLMEKKCRIGFEFGRQHLCSK